MITGIGPPIVSKASQMPQESPLHPDERRQHPNPDDATERATIEELQRVIRVCRAAAARPGITSRAARCFERIADALAKHLT